MDQVACRVCQGPVRAGYARCYRCGQHADLAGGLLADAVVPIGYAVKGGRLATDLWRYKAGREDSGPAAERLRGMLGEFVREHGSCVRRAAGMAGPGLVAVVPTGQGRPGEHPLAGIVASCVRAPLVRLVPGPGSLSLGRGRDLSAGWLRVAGDVTGRGVVVIDDTWVTGSSAQSAAVALKLAGAARVAVVILGRHVDPAGPLPAAFTDAAGAAPGAGPAASVPHPCARLK